MQTIISYLGHKKFVGDNVESLDDFSVKEHCCSPESSPESKEAGQARSTLGESSHRLFQTPRDGIWVDTL